MSNQLKPNEAVKLVLKAVNKASKWADDREEVKNQMSQARKLLKVVAAYVNEKEAQAQSASPTEQEPNGKTGEDGY